MSGQMTKRIEEEERGEGRADACCAPMQLAEYIADMTDELSRLASGADFGDLARILSDATNEGKRLAGGGR